VLCEIEELAKGIPNCRVSAANCLGACDSAPSALLWRNGREQLFTRILDVQKSVRIVETAKGAKLNLDDADMFQRMAVARQTRIRQQACLESKWNVALAGMSDQISIAPDRRRFKLQKEFGELLYKAGLWEEALDQFLRVQEAAPTNIETMMALAQIFSKLGRTDGLVHLENQVKRICCDPEDFRLELELSSRLSKFKTEAQAVLTDAPMERRIENYAIWHLESVTAVSQHSAIYHLISKDLKRGTPNPRGRGRSVWSKVWHTTLLAEVGANAEGPLPWVERDYTPISTSQEWERGHCDLLVKVYNDGEATSWLSRQPLGTRIWLSQPLRTLGVPSLVPQSELNETGFRPASCLLLLAGTGIVVAEQVLHHTETGKCFGASPALTSPIRLIQSCRSDDVLLTAELLGWCNKGKLESWSLLLTEAQAGMTPFPDAKGSDLTPLTSCPHVAVFHCRLSRELIQKELGLCPKPCRVVVSGPAGFNAACKSMLQDVGCETGAVTILSA